MIAGGPGTTYSTEEYRILIGRISDLRAGDPKYEARYRAHKTEVYQDLLRKGRTDLPNFEKFANIPDLDASSLEIYPVSDKTDDLRRLPIWWTTVDSVANLGFLGLPYFPYFSNCRGSDSYISISKTFETHPDCSYIDFDNTVYSNAFPWEGPLFPNSDQCYRTTPEELLTHKFINETVPWMDTMSGAIFDCLFEEAIDIPMTGILRWYESPSGTTLFYIGIYAYFPKDYEAVFDIDSKTNEKTYTQFWGRSNNISQDLGTYRMIEVQVDPNNDAVGGSFMVIPRQVRLDISYFQRSKGEKWLVWAYVQLMNNYSCHTLTNGGLLQQQYESASPPIPQCVTNIFGFVATSEYQLEIRYRALWWISLVNTFQFPQGIYLLFFFITGIFSVGVGSGIWGLNRLLTRLRHPPTFHFQVFFVQHCPTCNIWIGSISTARVCRCIYDLSMVYVGNKTY